MIQNEIEKWPTIYRTYTNQKWPTIYRT